MENKGQMHCHWYRCKHSECLHLVLGNTTLTFLPEQLLALANVIDEMRSEVLMGEQSLNTNFSNTNLIM
jgi:hypothetical protein